VTVVAFRWNPGADSGLETGPLNQRNRQFLDRINARGRVMLTATMLGEAFALRLCVVSFRTHRDRIEAALVDIRAALAEMVVEMAERVEREREG
jgi:aromatic-L-amino-acid decarboxylase